MKTRATLKHGGNVLEASRQFGRPPEQWLDLSTGISPWLWPVPAIPDTVWQRLPEQEDGLESAAAAYYGCSTNCLLAVPGSQFAIEALPETVARGTVALPQWGYAEHAYSWSRAGHSLISYRDFDHLMVLARKEPLQSAVVINPNNPSGEFVAPEQLLGLSKIMSANGGLLVVDEAFNDAIEGASLSSLFSKERFSKERFNSDKGSSPRGLVVLRSMGKFFGLAGLRLGFVIAHPQLLGQLDRKLSPWAVNHPARWLGQRALADTAWQQQQRMRLLQLQGEWSSELSALLPQFNWVSSPLFATGFAGVEQCRSLYAGLAQKGVLARLINPAEELPPELVKPELVKDEGQAAIRLGFPPSGEWARCIEAIKAVTDEQQQMSMNANA